MVWQGEDVKGFCMTNQVMGRGEDDNLPFVETRIGEVAMCACSVVDLIEDGRVVRFVDTV